MSQYYASKPIQANFCRYHVLSSSVPKKCASFLQKSSPLHGVFSLLLTTTALGSILDGCSTFQRARNSASEASCYIVAVAFRCEGRWVARF